MTRLTRTALRRPALTRGTENTTLRHTSGHTVIRDTARDDDGEDAMSEAVNDWNKPL
jgi:hypothetical protein